LQYTIGKTLLFFDELQEFPEIATALKFFEQDGRFQVGGRFLCEDGGRSEIRATKEEIKTA